MTGNGWVREGHREGTSNTGLGGQGKLPGGGKRTTILSQSKIKSN